MKYFALGMEVGAGSPPHLNGLLHEKIIENGQNVAPDYPWYWVEPGGKLAALPTTLYFHTKDPKYLFDIRSGYWPGDFFVSDGMLDIIKPKLPGNCQCAEVKLVSNYRSIADSKKYSYLRLDHNNFLSESIISEVSAKVDRRKTGEIKKILSLPLDSNSLPPIFMISEPSIAYVLFFSDDVRQECMRLKPVGVNFLSCADIGRLDRI